MSRASSSPTFAAASGWAMPWCAPIGVPQTDRSRAYAAAEELVAMAEADATQCGFCTPGFVMSLFTLYQSGLAPTREEIATHIAGNLCRCTGYRPIIDAGLASCTGTATPGVGRKSAILPVLDR